MAKNNIEPKTTAITFSKAQLLQSKTYAHRADLLGVLLEDRAYTQQEVEARMNQFMKGKGN